MTSDPTLAPPVHEVKVTRLVTFIVDVDALRNEEYEEDDEFDPQQAAEDFADGMEGSPVDNYATIDSVQPESPPTAMTITLATPREGLCLRRMLQRAERSIRDQEKHDATLKRLKPSQRELDEMLRAESRAVMAQIHAQLTEQGVIQ